VGKSLGISQQLVPQAGIDLFNGDAFTIRAGFFLLVHGGSLQLDSQILELLGLTYPAV